MHDSILSIAVRWFVKGFSVVAGLILGVVLLFTIIGSLYEQNQAGEPEIKYTYTPEIVPNAKGIRKSLSSSSPVILRVNIQGVIGLEDLTRQKVQQLFIESREREFKDNRVKAVLLYIDSPGGTVTDADGIYREIKAYKEQYKVPVYAYVDGLCASGGMYVACAADKIYSSEASIIGSVGVITGSALNFVKLMEKVGVDAKTLYAGKGKDELNPLRPWKEDEGKNYQDLINAYYNIFVNIVTTDRPEVNKEKLVNEYGAHIFLADKAQEIGFIDKSGVSLNDTLAQLAEHVGIKDDYYQVIELKEETWFKALFKANSNNALLTGEIKHRIVLQSDLDPKLMNQFLYLYRPE